MSAYRLTKKDLAALDFAYAYGDKQYKSKSGRRSAMTRDLNSTKKVIRRETPQNYEKWRHEPWKYDLKGVDTRGSSKKTKKSIERVFGRGSFGESSESLEKRLRNRYHHYQPPVSPAFSHSPSISPSPSVSLSLLSSTVSPSPTSLNSLVFTPTAAPYTPSLLLPTPPSPTAPIPILSPPAYSPPPAPPLPMMTKSNALINQFKNLVDGKGKEELVMNDLGNKQTLDIPFQIISECRDTNQGRRDYQEDVVYRKSTGRYSIFGVFDGHGGGEVSKALPEMFNFFLREMVDQSFPSTSNLANYFTGLFKEFDDELINNRQFQSGSTACVCIIDQLKRVLYLINLGDSRAIVVNDQGKILAATVDHEPNMERSYIEAHGGFVKNGRINGILGVGRAFGDADLKPYMSMKPDVYEVQINEPMTVVIATDGLWDVYLNQEVAREIRNFGPDVTKLCSNLVETALRKGSKDNVSVISARVQ